GRWLCKMSTKKIVGVTACSAGIAHTYMAAEALEKAGEDKGYDIKIETQGSIGVENELSDEEIAAADVVILAVEINIDMDRFNGIRVDRVRVVIAIKNSEKVRESGYENASLYGETGATAVVAITGKVEEGRCFQHFMAWIVYTIPVVIASG